jgi:hypothetical protein
MRPEQHPAIPAGANDAAIAPPNARYPNRPGSPPGSDWTSVGTRWST